MKRTTPRVLVAFLLLAGGGRSTAWAQGPETSGPPPEMKKLAFLVGKWVAGEQSSRPSAEQNNVPATCETTWTAGGRCLKSEVKRNLGNGRTFEYIRIIGYDPHDKVYRFWDFGAVSRTGLTEWSGQFEGSRLVMSMKLIEGGPEPAGIGIHLDPEPTPEGYVKVVRPFSGGPADRAGVKPGDLITKVDGKPAAVPGKWAGASLAGPAGTSLRLTIRSKGRERVVTVKRERFNAIVGPPRETYEPQPGKKFSVVTAQKEGSRYEKLGEEVFGPAP